MKHYEVTLWFEGDGKVDDDPQVTKLVEAEDKHTALDEARAKVRDSESGFDYRKVWAWVVHRIYI